MTVGPLLENCCGCKDDGCNNKCSINIESTNPDCLRVDTSECGVVKLEPVCPPEVIAGDNVTVDVIDCEDGEDCNFKYKVNANCEDTKVKACPDDTTPGTLVEKLEEGKGITITTNGCDGDTNSSLVISVNEEELNLGYPELKIEGSSNLINFGVGGGDGHTIYISDKATETYDNMCCIGFLVDQNFEEVAIDKGGNADSPIFMGENGKSWTIYTGNHKMAKADGITILADGYYRLFGQITVQNNINNDFYFNLGRGLLRIIGERPALDAENGGMYLSTAKHGAYARQMLLKAGSGIDITNRGEISSGNGSGQTEDGFDGPWMTFNIDTLVDLRKGDKITLGYRPQSSNMSNPDYPNNPIYGSFRFVGQNDSSTGYHALFGGTLLGCYQLAPKCFQEGDGNEVYGTI